MKTFSEFCPFYLGEHSNRTCGRLHFIGTSLGLSFVLHAFATLNFWWLLVGLAQGYAWAWSGTTSSSTTAPPPSPIRSTASSATG